MELFVVNRHEGDKPDKASQNDEKSKLEKVLKKIEKNKQLRQKSKNKDENLKEIIERTKEKRQIKREIKAKLAAKEFVAVPDNVNDEFIDQSLVDPESVEAKVEDKPSKKNKKKKVTNADIEGFTILGVDSFAKKPKVKRYLPEWLANPTVISVNLQNLQTKVSSLKTLDKSLRKLLKANGVTRMFPVQAEVIPWIIEANRCSDIYWPRDVCISAPTGSGKTLAFVLPVVQLLKKHTVKRIRALVILPTQDLAKQVFKTFRTYTEGSDIDVCLITGQNSFETEQKQLGYENEAFGYVSKVDVLVCTAGRLVDHIKMTEGFDLSHLEFLIIDEADRVLDNIQNDWLYHLENHMRTEDTPKVFNLYALKKRRPPQKLLFSATLSQDPEKLQKLSLFLPKLFTSVVENSENPDAKVSTETFVGKYTTPKELTEKYIETSADLKPLVLYKFIKEENLTKTLIFAHSVESAHRLAILLKAMFKDQLKVSDISSHLQAKNREALIGKFSKGDIDLLICTDSLARGIDLPGVQCVISYSAPKYLKTYIHRAGRTARAGELGLAVTLLHTSQLPRFKTLLKQADKTNVIEVKISEEDLEPLGEQYKESLEQLKETVEKEGEEELKKSLSAKRLKSKLKRKRKISTISVKSDE